MALCSLLRRAALPLLLACAAAAQVDLNPPPNPGAIRVDVNLVNLLCTVRDKQGAYVNDLSKDDFAVLDDGRRQPITHFARQVDSPLTVALLLDVSGSVQPILNIEKAAAGQFFSTVLRPDDRALLVGFAGHVMVWQNLTSSREYLRDALDRAEPMVDLPGGPPARGGTLLYDALSLVTAQKLKGLQGRKAAILMTDGEDAGSHAFLREAINAALNADTVIYGIHNADPGSSRGGGLQVLRAMSNATGGRTFPVTGKRDFRAVFAAIEEEMRNQYAIGYAVPEQAVSGAFHKVEVKAMRPGLTVQARTGYYAAAR